MRAVDRLVVIASLLGAVACAGTRPFTDGAGRVVPGSVATMQTIRLGGMEQRVLIRGRDVTAPVLVVLHGGPGVSETGLFRHYDAALEDHFVVVYWDQRGAGGSYRSDIPRDSMTISRLERDLDELVDTLASRFKNRRVVLLGHSWGTILGTLYASDHPEKVAAYIGVAQVANFARGERISLEWALAEAGARRDRQALRALGRLAPAPRSVDDELELGQWVERFGGTLRGGLSTGKLIWSALRTDEVALPDLARFGRGNRFSLEALRPEYSRVDLTGTRSFAVPVIFMLGRYDWHVPSVLAADYFDTIEAPEKRLIWFERSAHNPPFEEPEAFVRAMVTVVLPIARRSAAARPSGSVGRDVRSRRRDAAGRDQPLVVPSLADEREVAVDRRLEQPAVEQGAHLGGVRRPELLVSVPAHVLGDAHDELVPGRRGRAEADGVEGRNDGDEDGGLSRAGGRGMVCKVGSRPRHGAEDRASGRPSLVRSCYTMGRRSCAACMRLTRTLAPLRRIAM